MRISFGFEERGPKIAIGLRMPEGKLHKFIGLFNQRVLLEEQTATHRAVTPVCPLLPWPPGRSSGSSGIHSPGGPGERGIEVFQVSCNAIRLFLQLQPEPPFRQNASDG